MDRHHSQTVDLMHCYLGGGVFHFFMVGFWVPQNICFGYWGEYPTPHPKFGLCFGWGMRGTAPTETLTTTNTLCFLYELLNLRRGNSFGCSGWGA